ncbi:MAG: lysophospholipid acyltransferase family protein [Candidatus Omnitrophota bacterium]
MSYRILRLASQLLCKALFRLNVKGIENIPKAGGAIIAANHSSYLDPVVLAAASPRRISWIVRKDVYDVWWLKPMFVLTGMIRENGSVGKASALLEKGEVVGVFPEGTRSADGKLGAGRRGIAVMALKTGVPVIPCGISGAFEAYPRGVVMPRPFPVKVVICSAVEVGKDEAPDNGKTDTALAVIMAAIKGAMGD